MRKYSEEEFPLYAAEDLLARQGIGRIDVSQISSVSELARIHDLLTAVTHYVRSSPLPEIVAEQVLEPITENLTQVAWRATELKANSVPDLKAKSRILVAWTGEEKAEVSDQLAHSICGDISAIESNHSQPSSSCARDLKRRWRTAGNAVRQTF